MKMNTSGPQQGSFGIPPQVQEAAAKAREAAEIRRKRTEDAGKPAQASEEEILGAPALAAGVVPGEDDQKADDTNPMKIIERLGAKFEDEDFQRLLFKGFYETDLEVVPGRFKATFRTLIGDEYDEVDEILADEMKTVPMTNDGFLARRAMLIISYGVTHLMGKPVAKVVTNKDKSIDFRKTAAERRKVLGQLSPSVANLLIQKHGALTVAINQIVSSPDQHLKNS